MESSDCDKDLPLMANTKYILVNHYIFKLSCDFDARKMCGSVVLLLKPVLCADQCAAPSKNLPPFDDVEHSYASNNEISMESECDTKCSSKESFVLVLDSSNIVVTTVQELCVNEPDAYKFCCYDWSVSDKRRLEFAVEKWCLKIWKPGVVCSCSFPHCIVISYETHPRGESLLWVSDQDGKPAVYTYGAWINNRSIFPCQEPPIAMATWEASISVADPAVVIMSGDERAKCSSNEGVSTYYYYTKTKLPLSTLALAVGYWNVEDITGQLFDLNVDVRLWASQTLVSEVAKEFSVYIHSCLRAAESVLGVYPFPRIDFLVVPRGFASLGMASPNVIFISQSLIAGDGSMCCRIAHEITHAWFGLLIGASDWTEEWLSEGFATFMEDVIHAKAMSMSSIERKEYCEVKAFMRAKTLCAEMKNTEEELHILRPNKGEVQIENVDGVEALILKNGKNPEKGFMQVHYIKGYFLLKYLSDLVGQSAFLNFLHSYIIKYRGQLVDSLEMLQFFVQSFRKECSDSITVEKIAADWLHSSKISKEVSGLKLSLSNSIYQMAVQEAEKWSRLNRSYITRKTKKRKKLDTDHFAELSTEILVLVLDILLRKEVLSHSVLKLISQVYVVDHQNAEVRHRWCELVVKHRYYAGYGALQNFLENDLAMGVYLYGELILGGTRSQRDLADQCFHKMRPEMEPNCIVTILEMLNQTADSVTAQ